MIRKIVKEKLDEIRELNDEVNHDYLTSYLMVVLPKKI